MKIRSTPFRGMFSSMAIEYREETLTANRVEVNDERMGIFHGSSSSLVLRYAHLEGRIFGGMSVQDLDNCYRSDDDGIELRTYTMSVEFDRCYRFGTSIWRIAKSRGHEWLGKFKVVI